MLDSEGLPILAVEWSPWNPSEFHADAKPVIVQYSLSSSTRVTNWYGSRVRRDLIDPAESN
jgi:hypothetical protein